jgi:hypothetical protein
VENPTAATAGRAADAMAARQWRCSPRFRADAHKYTITYELCSIRMVRTKNCARRTSHGLAPPSSARNPPAAGSEGQQAVAAVVQVCHAGSAATPTTCTMSHHVQDGGQQEAAAGVLSVSCRLSRHPVLCHTICSARNSRAPLAAGFEEGQAAAAVVQRRIQIRFIMRTVAQVTLQAQPLPQPPALCHTM